MKITWANPPSQNALNAAYKEIIPKAVDAYLKSKSPVKEDSKPA